MTESQDNDVDIELNLVFDNPSSSHLDIRGGDVGIKNRKRRNKYDQRREKGRLAKLAKLKQHVSSESSPTASSLIDGPSSSLEKNTALLNDSLDERDHGESPSTTDSPDTILCKANTESITTNNVSLNAVNQNDEMVQYEGGAKIFPSLASVTKEKGSASISVLNSEQSTRVNLSSSTSNRALSTLSEEEQRARYLLEFHARPRDLDRNEKASREIKASLASNHIFEGYEFGNEGDIIDKTDDDLNGTNTLCPFQKLGLHRNIVSALTYSSGYFRLNRPTIVQKNAISALLPRNSEWVNKKPKNLEYNLFIQSETGSGKTLAYLLPILQHLAGDSEPQTAKLHDRQLGGTRAIILTPTRELATQIYTVASHLCPKSFPWLVPGCFSGGEKRKSEKARLRKGITILIATPGRLLDHLCKTESLLSALKGKLEWLVLDEADRLLDAGLGGQVEQIVQHLRSNQPGAGLLKDGVTWRSILVSATVTGDMEGLAKTVLGGQGWLWAWGHTKDATSKDESLKDAEDHGKQMVNELDNSAPRQLAQLYMVVSAKLRLSSLIAFLASRVSKHERTVVFMSTCDSVDYHYALFTAMTSIFSKDDGLDNIDLSSGGLFGSYCQFYKLHGDIPHSQRIATMKQFSGQYLESPHNHAAILLATDVASRGLNFPSLDWIVQYDPPCETKDYVHRAGRSARAGQAGHALLFILPSERQYIEVLQVRGLKEISALSLSSTLTAASQLCPSVTQEGESKASGNVFSDRSVEAFTVGIQNRLEECVLQDDVRHKAAFIKKGKDAKHRRKIRRDAVGPLLEGARRAFSAFVRAYPAKEKAVRHLFNARALHLGHIARSFALKETPKIASKVNISVMKVFSEDENVKDAASSRLVFDGTGRVENGVFNGLTRGNSKEETNESTVSSVTGKRSTKTATFNSKKSTQYNMMEAARLLQAQGMEFM